MNKFLKKIFASLAVILLISCGSNQNDAADKLLTTGISTTTKSPEFGKPATSKEIQALSKELGSYFNGQFANNPQALTGAPATANAAAKATPMIAASNVASAVYRFYNTQTSTHFYTMSASERDYVQTTFPQFNFEGISFYAYPSTDPALSPVYRFFNKVSGTHFYTINASEKDHVIATWPHIFNFEGISWYASTSNQANWIPVYRFFNTRTGAHFYTTNAGERDHVRATFNWFNFEGIAYYVKEDASSTCIPPNCYPPAARPAPTSSRNVFWLRTDSSRYEYLTSNNLIYSEASYPPINTYDSGLRFNFDGISPGAISFFIKPEPGGQLRIGLTKYATRSSIFGALNPGLDIGVNGSGCNNITGAYFIHELGVATDGRVIVFAADFNISCDGGDFANGAVRFNSDIPSVLPRVFANAGTDFSVQAGSKIPLVGDLSWSPSSKIRSAQWTQVSGPAIALSQCAQLNCIAYAPLVPAGGANAVLKLTVVSESGLVSSDTVNITIRE